MSESADKSGAGKLGFGQDALAGSHLLVVDDEESLREMLTILLEGAGATVQAAPDGQVAIAALAQRSFDVVVTDVSMPIVDGHEVLQHVRQYYPETPVIMMTAVNKEVADTVEAMKRGAFDYIHKGYFNNDEFFQRVVNAVERKRLREENLRLKGELADRRGQAEIVGRGDRMKAILSVVERVAATNSTVLITGESGTGKELVARTLHAHSGREGQFLTVNCGALPDELLESEMFGHVMGSFTGAVGDKVGLYERADGGTLFLDEIGETSPALQVKLLRVLQEGTFRPVGATDERKADVRVVTATNRDLEEMTREGTFREDLFYRINVIPVHVPPLRERRDDVQAMVAHFTAQFAAEMDREIQAVPPETMELLEKYHWPGNVRELKNVIERAVALATDAVLDPATLPEAIREGKGGELGPSRPELPLDRLPEGVRLDDYLDDIRRRCIESALELTGGNQTRAAEELRITFRALRYYVQKYDLKPEGPTRSSGSKTGGS